MALNVSAWSISQPVPAVVLFVVLLALGWVSFSNLPITKFPNIDVPIISVTVTQSGAAPAELETQVARKVEDAVTSVSGVKHVQSTVTDGKSSTVDRVLAGGQHRPGAQRRQGRGRPRSARICRATSTSRSSAASMSRTSRS